MKEDGQEVTKNVETNKATLLTLLHQVSGWGWDSEPRHGSCHMTVWKRTYALPDTDGQPSAWKPEFTPLAMVLRTYPDFLMTVLDKIRKHKRKKFAESRSTNDQEFRRVDLERRWERAGPGQEDRVDANSRGQGAVTRTWTWAQSGRQRQSVMGSYQMLEEL